MKRNNESTDNRPEQESHAPLELIELYANRRPQHKEGSLYRLRIYTYGQISCYEPTMAYPKFGLTRYYDSLYRSLEEAKNAVGKLIVGEERQDLSHFLITQVELGELIDADCGNTWLFDRDDNLVDYSVGGRYFGRTPERTRFHKGDIVEVITDNRQKRQISLAVVVDTPPSVEDCHKLFNESIQTGEDYCLTSLRNDCYMVADTPEAKPKSVQSVRLLAPRFPVDDSLKSYFRECLETVRNDKPSPGDCQNCIDSEWKFAVMGGLHAYIERSEYSRTPVIHLHNRDWSFETEIRLDCPDYSPNCNRRLAKWQKSALVDYLTAVDYGRTRWWYMLRSFLEWDNGDVAFLDTPIPDYRLLPD